MLRHLLRKLGDKISEWGTLEESGLGYLPKDGPKEELTHEACFVDFPPPHQLILHVLLVLLLNGHSDSDPCPRLILYARHSTRFFPGNE